jgi:hypothetical protein
LADNDPSFRDFVLHDIQDDLILGNLGHGFGHDSLDLDPNCASFFDDLIVFCLMTFLMIMSLFVMILIVMAIVVLENEEYYVQQQEIPLGRNISRLFWSSV